jgi:hypothetical protein
MVRQKFCKIIHLPPWATVVGVLPPCDMAAGAVAPWQGHIPPWGHGRQRDLQVAPQATAVCMDLPVTTRPGKYRTTA